jgi:hypothetical protein
VLSSIHYSTDFFSNITTFANVLTLSSVHHLVQALAFSQSFFKGLVTYFTMPLDPSNDAS